MSERRVLVVGTTSDYIEYISKKLPGRALFLTDFREREKAQEPQPKSSDEITVDLDSPSHIEREIGEHLTKWDICLSGIASFDCESLFQTSQLAKQFDLPYVSPTAVTASRNKFLCKQLWQQAGLFCPKARTVRNLEEALGFQQELSNGVVIKPLSGSGSELVFLCRNRFECTEAFRLVRKRLPEHPNKRMYSGRSLVTESGDPQTTLVMEEYIEGQEFSCDFIIDKGKTSVIRVAEKIYAPGQPLGTVLAYILPALFPAGLKEEVIAKQLQRAAEALGIERAVCMVDFIVRDGKAYLIEMTPRVGGDCLPRLIIHSAGLDMLGLALDFAEGRRITVPPANQWHRLMGVRLFAENEGIISNIDGGRLNSDSQTRELYLKRGPGHEVILPPYDYDSRYLGYLITEPPTESGASNVEKEALELASRLALEMEPHAWQAPKAL